MPLILVSVAKVTGGGSSDKTFSPAIKAAISTEFMKLRPPVSLTDTDADTAAVIEFPVGAGNNQYIEKWQLSITLNQLITAINAVEVSGATLGAALTAIDALTPEANALIVFTDTDSATKLVVRDGILDMLGKIPALDQIISFTDADNCTMITMGASGKAILQAANGAALKAAGVQITSEKNAASGYVGITAARLIELPNASGAIASTLSSADDTATRGRKLRDASGEIAVQFRGTGTFVAGQLILNASNLGGAANLAMITASTQVRLNGISALNASPALGVDYTVTIAAGTSITIDMYDALGAAAVTDVASRYFEVSW